MPSFVIAALLPILPVLVLLSGCSKQDDAPVPQPSVRIKKESRVVLPESVQGKWSAVKIAVQDKEKNQREVYTVDIGRAISLSEGDLTLKVENFLPYFQMDGMTLTSASNELKNPAARIVMYQDGRQIFRGWLFSLYPNTHAFQHPRFSCSLVDFVPSS